MRLRACLVHERPPKVNGVETRQRGWLAHGVDDINEGQIVSFLSSPLSFSSVCSPTHRPPFTHPSLPLLSSLSLNALGQFDTLLRLFPSLFLHLRSLLHTCRPAPHIHCCIFSENPIIQHTTPAFIPCMTATTETTTMSEANGKEFPPTLADLKSSRKTGSAYSHTFPVHTKTTPSPLSKEAPPESYRGFVNLGMLLLFGNNIRLIIENYLKYGFLLSFPGSNVSNHDWILTAITHGLLPLNVLLAHLLERWAMKKAIGFRKRLQEDRSAKTTVIDEKPKKQGPLTVKAAASANQSVVGWLHFLNVFFIIAWPSFMSYYMIFHPFMAMSALMNGCILFLKMTSYALVNHDLRAAYIFDLPKDSFHHLAKVHDVAGKVHVRDETFTYDVQYPDNIAITNIGYFWFAPTLCYQPSYPRTTVFRKSFFIKRVLEILTCLGMMYFLIEQYATPTLRNSVGAFDQLAFGTIVERVLKLSTTSVIIWLLMFYTFFHACFNALAEILYFGDRCFYLAWWNAVSLQQYWKWWNKPVYTFFKRHVYLPLITKGWHPITASIIIFTISAILHEVLIGFPTHMILGYAFAGMFFQIPLIAITAPLEKWRGPASGLGNMIFWVSFTIVGQPACALLYYYQWTKRHVDDGAVITGR